MANDDGCKAALIAIEQLQGMISKGYTLRIQEVDGRVFIFANHFLRGNMAGQGRSLVQAISNLESNEEDL